MLELGRTQELTVVKKVDFGIYLAETKDDEEKVLLPKKQVPEGIGTGDRISVFLYRDSKDRLIATTTAPLLQLGQVEELTVVQTGKIGAFLDWGLEKDLLLPFREQTREVQAGDRFMKIYHYLRTDSPYQKDDRVEGYVYEISRQFGAFVAVDGKYSALVPVQELFGQVHTGDRVKARVTKVLDDGKLNLSLREKAYLQIGTDAKKVLEIMEQNGGKLPFTDKADPDLIRSRMGMSKNEFKRAVGGLLKEGNIQITENEIRKL